MQFDPLLFNVEYFPPTSTVQVQYLCMMLIPKLGTPIFMLPAGMDGSGWPLRSSR